MLRLKGGQTGMREPRLIGRNDERRKLERCLDRQEAQLIVVQGRRRVGKTFLINHFFENGFDFKLTGEYKASKAEQLENFVLELNRRTHLNHKTPESWKAAFDMLRSYLSVLPKGEKHIVFFDEMPWMDTPRSDFLKAFEYFWNDFGSALDNLVFIICGSATAWITEHIERNKGGLFNRKTCSLFLQPFCLKETAEYLQMIGIDWSEYDIAQCHMILGGIPYYLSFLNPAETLNENIDNLFFRKSAELADEFDNLFRTLFSGSNDYQLIVSLLSQKRYGMTLAEIARSGKLTLNGNLSTKVNHLVQSGFLCANPFYGQKKKEIRYQLSDYFSLFHCRFVRENYGRDDHFWCHTNDNPSRYAWAGLTFELLCRDHLNQIRQKLGISGVQMESSTWRTRSAEGQEESNGAQIDMIIDRRDRIISLCEIKYSLHEFEIDTAYDMNLRNKIEAFRKETGTSKTLQLVMITTYGVKKNKYSNIVSGQVMLEDLFRPVS